jgi:hypothetical protein
MDAVEAFKNQVFSSAIYMIEILSECDLTADGARETKEIETMLYACMFYVLCVLMNILGTTTTSRPKFLPFVDQIGWVRRPNAVGHDQQENKGSNRRLDDR